MVSHMERNPMYFSAKCSEPRNQEHSSYPEKVKGAMKWARQENLNLDYQLGQVEDFNPHGNLFDLVAIVYVHLIPEIRAKMFHLLAACVKPGGKLILECFHKNQLDFRTGGPVLEDMLYSEEELLSDFITLDIELCKEFKVDIFEGRYHKGTSSVIRIVACMG